MAWWVNKYSNQLACYLDIVPNSRWFLVITCFIAEVVKVTMASSEPNSRLKTMAADVRRFVDQGRIVREVLQDTVDVFGKMKSFSNRSVSDTASLTDVQSSSIRRVFESPPSIIVLGRKELRRPILNFLVGSDIFPRLLDTMPDVEWKMVAIKHGKQTTFRQTYCDSGMLDSYEVAEASAVVRSMSRDKGLLSPALDVHDIVIRRGDDASLLGTRVEVTLDSPLLESGMNVVSCATHSNYAVENIDECTKDRLPFFIFPLDLSSSLSLEVC